jgi:hypothetical protein
VFLKTSENKRREYSRNYSFCFIPFRSWLATCWKDFDSQQRRGLSSSPSSTNWILPNFLWFPVAHSSWVKLPGSETDHPPLSGADDKTQRGFASTLPYVCLHGVVLKHTKNFTYYIYKFVWTLGLYVVKRSYSIWSPKTVTKIISLKNLCLVKILVKIYNYIFLWWAGHGEKRYALRFLMGTPEGKRPPQRHRCR